jgi:mannan endo-1,4-beta-mannosidase
LPAIDVMSYHLYPDHWGTDAAWGTGWIERHNAEARRLRKPVMLGEFGLRDKATRNPVYQRWTDAVVAGGGAGFLYWILSGAQDDGTLYPDYDGFTVYCPSPVCTTLSNAAASIRAWWREPRYRPVADHDPVATDFGTPVAVPVTANDIGYGVRVRPETLDLDPARAGRQAKAETAGGVFLITAPGVVTFTPVDGFAGRATASYTVRDQRNRTSNVADVVVTVKPDPAGALRVASFEDGTQGWASAPWQANGGTVERSDEFATDGAYSLRVAAADGGWFGLNLAEPLDLSTRVTLRYDLRTDPAQGSNAAVAVQTGAGFAWCQSTFAWVNQNSTYAAEIDLLNAMSCDATALADVRAIWVYVNPGTHFVDNVRVE